MSQFWITKYALTSGVKIAVGEKRLSSGKVYVDCKDYYTFFTLGIDVFESEAAAVADAEMKRWKKVSSLKKQIVKLQSMKIKVSE